MIIIMDMMEWVRENMSGTHDSVRDQHVKTDFVKDVVKSAPAFPMPQ